MLTLWGTQSDRRMCDGQSRRDFLRVGALGLGGVGGLSLADLFRLEAQGAVRQKAHKAVIMVHLPGGPSHIDMYDMKPDAPEDYRGEFKPIQTRVPGMNICQLMPLQAQIADQLAIVRGVRTTDRHNPYELFAGVPTQNAEQIGNRHRPVFGSIVSRLRGGGVMPPYVSIGNHRNLLKEEPEDADFLGPKHNPIRLNEDFAKNWLATMSPGPDLTLNRLEDRKSLLASLDQLRRNLDNAPGIASMDQFQARALQVISSSAVRDAFDLTKEPDRVRVKYGQRVFPWTGLDFLLARRLVEAGVSVVTVAAHFGGGWDTHGDNFKRLRENLLPMYDRAVYALVTDLRDRGLDKDVAVIFWGEFGRKPKIGDQKPDGRSHWAPAGCALLAGGGLRMGQVVGETDRLAEQPKGRHYSAQNLLATLYHVLGIDAAKEMLPDPTNRPMHLLDDCEKIAALI
jgi:hypothetical protein